MPFADAARLDAITVDALGTLLELNDPVPALAAALADHGEERPFDSIREAFLAEARYYRPRSLEGRDAASLAGLRSRCVGIFLDTLQADLDPASFVRPFMAAISFRPAAGVSEALDTLRAAGLVLACVANWDVGLHEHLCSLSLDHHFQLVLTSAEAGAAKPDPSDLRARAGADRRRTGARPSHRRRGGRSGGRSHRGARLRAGAPCHAPRANRTLTVGLSDHTLASANRPVPRQRRALGLWLLVAGIQIVAAFAGNAGGSTDDGREPLYEYSLAIGSLVLYAILLGVTFWIGSTLPDRRSALGLRRFPPSLALARRWELSSQGSSSRPRSSRSSTQVRSRALRRTAGEPSKTLPFLLNALVIVTVVPFTEELFFRGLGVTVFTIFGSTVAILATALVFGLAHGIPAAIPALGFFGVCLAWLRVRTDSVWPGVVAHSLYNALGIVGFLLTTSS